MFNRKLLYGAIVALGCTGAFATEVPLSELAPEPSAIAVDPVIGRAFVTHYADGTLSEIDMSSFAAQTTDAGQHPGRAIADAATHLLYVLNDTSPGYVSVFDTRTNAPVARIGVGDSPRGMAADFGRAELYVSNHGTDSLSIVDLGVNRVITTFALPPAPGAIDVDRVAGRIYVASADGSLSIIDQASRTLIASAAIGSKPGSVTADERTGKVYVNNIDDATVSVIDGRDGRLLATLAVGAGSTLGTVSALYHHYYLPNSADGTVSIIDTDADVLLRTVAVGDAPEQVAIDGATARMYVLNRQDNELAMFDPEGTALTGRAPAGSNPVRMVAEAGRVLVLNEEDGSSGAVTLVEPSRLPDPTSIVTEYASSTSGDFFHSADGIENRVLADGLFGTSWRSTMQFWRVWDSPGEGRQAMCRFASSDLQAVGTHFYTASPEECAALKEDARWQYEGTAYYVALPDGAGNCPDGTVSLYRLYDDTGGAPFHRYTTDASIKAGMKNGGWKSEGTGAESVFACVPSLSASAVAAAPALITDDGSLTEANPTGTRHIALPPFRPIVRQP